MRVGNGKSHAKIILIGEHAVVYGTRAIAIPFFKTRCKASVRDSDEVKIVSGVYSGLLENAPSSMESIVSLIRELTRNLNLPKLEYIIESEIPISSGMGSSAAVASSIVEAVYDYLDLDLSDSSRFEWIQFSERIAHGNPSGIDALTTTHDDALLFQKGYGAVKFPSKLNAYLVVGQTGEPGNTKEAVSAVKRKVTEENKEHVINEIGVTVEECFEEYQNGNVEAVGKTLTKVQKKLKELDVSTPIIDEMVDLALESGALGAKLTGGGRGGCVIALARNNEDANKLKKAWEDYNNQESWILNLNEV